MVHGAARKVLGDRDFVFGDELTRDNLLKIAVTADELREVNVQDFRSEIADSRQERHVPLRTAAVPDKLQFWIGFSQAVVRRERFYCL